MLDSLLGIVVVATGRASELEWLGGIETHNAIVRSSCTHVAICEHRRWSIQSYCATVSAGSDNISGNGSNRKTRAGRGIITCLRIGREAAHECVPGNIVGHIITLCINTP